MSRFLFVLVLLITMIPALLWANEPPYLTVKPKKGDGIMSILRRHKLLDSKCNKKHFYEINNLTPKSQILTGKTYKLPIFVYTYNGKSIRSSIGDDDFDKAVRIQEFNKNLYKEKVKPSRFNKKGKKLWVPYNELFCETDFDPAIKPVQPNIAKNSKVKNFPIFGDKYANTKILSHKLRNQVFYIVSGHGGPDPGAMGKYGKYTLCEDEYAYDVSLRLCRYLIQHGATAYMITRDENDGIRTGAILPCDNDETAWRNQKIYLRQKSRLFQRSEAINRLYRAHKKQGVTKQRMISIHIDSRAKNNRADVFFYYFRKSEKGRKLALRMMKTFRKKYQKHQKNRGYEGKVQYRDLHMLRETSPTSVYVELGNIRNASDQKRFVIESNRDVLSKWLFEGLAKFRP